MTLLPQLPKILFAIWERAIASLNQEKRDRLDCIFDCLGGDRSELYAN
jgi:hypothetical protein